MKAFTLVEVVVVLVVVAVAAGLIVPRMSGSLARREAREAVGEFAATARTVRELAVARGQMFSIQIDLDRGGYTVVTRQAEGAKSGEPSAVQASWLKAGRWPSSVRQASVRTPDGTSLLRGTHRVDFNPDGTSSGAAVCLAGEEESDAYRIVICPRTGRVVVGDGRSEPPPEQGDLGD